MVSAAKLSGMESQPLSALPPARQMARKLFSLMFPPIRFGDLKPSRNRLSRHQRGKTAEMSWNVMICHDGGGWRTAGVTGEKGRKVTIGHHSSLSCVTMHVEAG